MLLGFDPGGTGAFGWCVVEHSAQLPIRIRCSGTANDAEAAVAAALSCISAEDTVLAAAIDAPLFWVASGDRQADQLVRNLLCQAGGHSSSVQHVNSLKGACLVQGVLTGLLLREVQANLPITESHPKALLWILGIANHALPTVMATLQDLTTMISSNGITVSAHERDAAIATLSAWAMVENVATWRDVYPLEVRPHCPLAPPLAYWTPINVAQAVGGHLQ